MSAAALQARVGALVWFEAAPGLQVLCIVSDARRAFGRVDVQIEPARGAGSAWVQDSSIQPLTEAEAKKEIA